jgi:hypothetical protein
MFGNIDDNRIITIDAASNFQTYVGYISDRQKK